MKNYPWQIMGFHWVNLWTNVCRRWLRKAFPVWESKPQPDGIKMWFSTFNRFFLSSLYIFSIHKQHIFMLSTFFLMIVEKPIKAEENYVWWSLNFRLVPFLFFKYTPCLPLINDHVRVEWEMMMGNSRWEIEVLWLQYGFEKLLRGKLLWNLRNSSNFLFKLKVKSKTHVNILFLRSLVSSFKISILQTEIST